MQMMTASPRNAGRHVSHGKVVSDEATSMDEKGQGSAIKRTVSGQQKPKKDHRAEARGQRTELRSHVWMA